MPGKTTKYSAFISYASRYAPWVERFHHDLERSLHSLGAKDRVFFDRKELVSGQSWVDQLERGIEQADHLILVLTPEALASEWVSKERSSFMVRNRAQRLGDQDSDLEKVAWFGEGSGGQTHEVGQKDSNKWDLYDMHGNVWEWAVSPWTSDYPEQASSGSRTVDPVAIPADLAQPDPRDRGVFRGGSYWVTPQDVRSAFRFHGVPGSRNQYLGFRVLLPSAPSEN